MSKEPKTEKPLSWPDAVANRCKCTRNEIQTFVRKYKIPLSPAIGRPKRIHITDIVFSGKKAGLHTNDFEFKFEKLSPGIWGLFSDGNGKGKSSVLEVIKWLFRGRISDGLQSGVKIWIRYAALTFQIDETIYQVEVTQDGEILNGELKRSNAKLELQSYKSFSSEDEMAAVMSDFMMDQLELERFASHKKGDNELDSGSEVTHGWPALSSAMFIGTSYGAIFGDVAMAGLPNRILNMYMGLPWIPTQAALKALEGQLKAESTVEDIRVDRAKEDRKKRLLDIQSQLAEKNKAFALLPEPLKSKQGYNKLVEEYNRAYELSNDANRRLAETKVAFDTIDVTYNTDKISLQNFKEDKAANKIFKQLNPTCCPHCEQKISKAQLEKEKTQHTCAICDRTMIDSEDSEELLSELTEKLQASTKALQEIKEVYRNRVKAAANAESLMSECNRSALLYKTELDAEAKSSSEIYSLNQDIARLLILEKEYSEELPDLIDSKASGEPSTTETLAPTNSESGVPESKILAAALSETESRFKGLQTDLLQGVSEKMMEYCGKVGLGQYKELKLTGQPSLKIVKDGSETTFSRVSKGEQLRLKVLATIALISVAEERNLGRHPGFLIIDSPAAQEVNQDDLNNLIAGLEDLKKSLPSLQIILASVANETLLRHVDDQHRIYAKDQDYLW